MPYERSVVKGKYRPKATKLLDQVREVMRYHHYSIMIYTHVMSKDLEAIESPLDAIGP